MTTTTKISKQIFTVDTGLTRNAESSFRTFVIPNLLSMLFKVIALFNLFQLFHSVDYFDRLSILLSTY